jgi:N-methylhydantoinase B
LGLPGWDTGRTRELIKNPDTEAQPLPSKYDGLRFKAGESVLIAVPSSGGYGDPLDRPAALVHENVLDDIVSVENAKTVYGVVIEEGQLNVELTEQSRTTLRSQR